MRAVVHGTMMLVMSEAECMLPIAVHVLSGSPTKMTSCTSAPGLLMNDASRWNSYTFTLIRYIAS